MSDIIQLLPDSIANQIAAGEVIQRPASVVKELVENAVDSGADKIIVNIKNAGKTLIQVIDNGQGMSETDARMAFERHATSKIKKANDLFEISTMGFRGEALASVAAVAEIELKTKLHNNELGSYLHIKGSNLISQEIISCPNGSNFGIKNLFYNIPARRKFLKRNVTEFNYIKSEFQKIALANPEIRFSLIHNENKIYVLEKGNLRQRIVGIFGKNINQKLIPAGSDTSILKIFGYIGKPDIAKKTRKEQYFFVNKRFIKHPYFYKAISSAYEQIINSNAYPVFFIYFEIEPNKIDINIHPAKTEINFEDSQGIFRILRATVKEALGKFNIVPSIDFDREGEIKVDYSIAKKEIHYPETATNPEYNPFNNEVSYPQNLSYNNKNKKDNWENWESLYENFEQNNIPKKDETNKKLILSTDEKTYSKILQLRNKYIVTPVKSGLMFINQKRAHERILYEKFLKITGDENIASQKILYPLEIPLNLSDYELIQNIFADLKEIGFDISGSDGELLIIKAVPSFLISLNIKDFIEQILINLKDDITDIKEHAKERLSEITAKSQALTYDKKMNSEEMKNIINKLFACQTPGFTPSGKTIMSIIKYNDIDRLF